MPGPCPRYDSASHQSVRHFIRTVQLDSVTSGLPAHFPVHLFDCGPYVCLSSIWTLALSLCPCSLGWRPLHPVHSGSLSAACFIPHPIRADPVHMPISSPLKSRALYRPITHMHRPRHVYCTMQETVLTIQRGIIKETVLISARLPRKVGLSVTLLLLLLLRMPCLGIYCGETPACGLCV